MVLITSKFKKLSMITLSATIKGRCHNKGCGNDGDKSCSVCRYAQYCSVSCQKEHWVIHKFQCKQMKNDPKTDSLRLLQKLDPFFVTIRTILKSKEAGLNFLDYQGAKVFIQGNYPLGNITDEQYEKNSTIFFVKNDEHDNIIEESRKIYEQNIGKRNKPSDDFLISLVHNGIFIPICNKKSDIP